MAEQSSNFTYVTYIRTTPEALWHALTDAATMRQYWFGAALETDWRQGAAWRLVFTDGRVADTGEVLECEKPRRIVLKWRHEFRPELKAEGYARCVIELEQIGEVMKLSIAHSMERAESGLIQAVSGGWPRILANLKSLLETGQVILK